MPGAEAAAIRQVLRPALESLAGRRLIHRHGLLWRTGPGARVGGRERHTAEALARMAAAAGGPGLLDEDAFDFDCR